MANRLINATSPYLLQHANNPVDWYPWSEEAFHKALAEDKPIFLSIGYAACHWCHVMARESFEDETIAAIMNQYFINIKVDREEMPHIDNAYMNAVIAMTGHGGWPLSVFLTPQRVPFYGGTYFPAVSKYNLPSFKELLLAIAKAWQAERSTLIENSEKLLHHLNKTHKPSKPKTSVTLSYDYLQQAVTNITDIYDWDFGGWGNAPKFPQAMGISFLTKMASRGEEQTLKLIDHALKAMAQGGMYDLVGGGFSRYSVDPRWCVPHFEKMLYDNALLAQAYLQGYLLTANDAFREICERTLNFILREMTNSMGGFFSSLDADSEHEEGKYYLWTKTEIEGLLTKEEFDFFAATHEMPKQGHFEGKLIIRRSGAIDTYLQPTQNHASMLNAIYQKLFTAREKRIKPSADEKVLTSWNALMLWSFSEAGRYLDTPEYTAAAEKNAEFILNYLIQDDKLYHAWYQGTVSQPAYLEDYAALVLALLSLYQTTQRVDWFVKARSFLGEAIDRFQDPNGGFFDTDPQYLDIPFKSQTIWQDNATPSANAMITYALLLMDAFTGDEKYNQLAVNQLSHIIEDAVKHPLYYSSWLQNAALADVPLIQVAVLGDPHHPNTQNMRKIVWEKYRPNIVYVESDYPPPPEAPTILQERPLRGKLPTAYVCEFFYCRYPTNKPEELSSLLSKKSL